MPKRRRLMYPIPESAYSYLIEAAKQAGDDATLDILHSNRWEGGFHDQEDTALHMLRKHRKEKKIAPILNIFKSSKGGIVRDTCCEFFDGMGFSREEVEDLSSDRIPDIQVVDETIRYDPMKTFLMRLMLKGKKVNFYRNRMLIKFDGWEIESYLTRGYRSLDLWFNRCEFDHGSGMISRDWSFRLYVLNKANKLEMVCYEHKYPKNADGMVLGDIFQCVNDAANRSSGRKYSYEEVLHIFWNPVNLVRSSIEGYMTEDEEPPSDRSGSSTTFMKFLESIEVE